MTKPVILLGLGGNLPHPDFGSPKETLGEALRRLSERGVRLVALSPWYKTAPVPVSDQPWYQNAVAEVATDLTPAALLALLHEVEAELGRVRGQLNAARIIDLDLLDFKGIVSKSGESPMLPHPRLHLRAFVLLPLGDLVPAWRHPVSGKSVAELIAALPSSDRAGAIRA